MRKFLALVLAAAGAAAQIPAAWHSLIGDYGPDGDIIYILERDGRLMAMLHQRYSYPLKPQAANVFLLPDGGKVTFTATQLTIGSTAYARRTAGAGADGIYRIHPQRPVAVLRREALAAKPPVEKGEFRKPDLVELTALDPAIKLDIRYATSQNFLSTPVYPRAKAMMQRPAAEALARAHRKLKEQGFGLLIHDAYRPWYVTKIFWDATPPDKRIFVADPAQGSRHNRGCAVDLTMYDLKTGAAVEMPGVYDEMSERSYPNYPGGTSIERSHRDTLRRAMEAEGFTVFDTEWWHFDYRLWREYAILNQRF